MDTGGTTAGQSSNVMPSARRERVTFGRRYRTSTHQFDADARQPFHHSGGATPRHTPIDPLSGCRYHPDRGSAQRAMCRSVATMEDVKAN
jgi:hypothetical protein